MKWWNDVWLNESFADYISHYCLSNIKLSELNLDNTWVIFNQRKSNHIPWNSQQFYS